MFYGILIRMFFYDYGKLNYRARTDNPGLTAKAKACAMRLGLVFERRFTGCGDLATAVGDVARDTTR